jgi:hypothetical protein
MQCDRAVSRSWLDLLRESLCSELQDTLRGLAARLLRCEPKGITAAYEKLRSSRIARPEAWPRSARNSRITQRLANVRHLPNVIRVMQSEECQLVGHCRCIGQLHGCRPGEIFVLE